MLKVKSAKKVNSAISVPIVLPNGIAKIRTICPSNADLMS